MSNFSIVISTLAVIGCVVVLFALNFSPYLSTYQGKTWILIEDIRGSAVEHDQKLFTLNFDQQNSLIEYINLSVPEKKEGRTQRTRALQVQKIIVYRFHDQANVEILPVDYDAEDNLVFSAPLLLPDMLLKDTSNGKLKQMLAQTYDQ